MTQPSVRPTVSFFADLNTPRLDLLPVTRESLLCQRESLAIGRPQLAAILHAEVPDSWPPEHWEPHVVEYLLSLVTDDPEAEGWCRYVALRSHTGRVLIGTVGCGFPKPETGEAEFGYGILPAWQRNGYATEAVKALLLWIRTRRPVPVFVAQTFPDLTASIRVLEKCGMRPCGPGFEPGAILFREEVSTFSLGMLQ